jgi:hypothetical protein
MSFDEEYQTDEVVMGALEEIAENDKCDFDYLWRNGYTKIHNTDEVQKMVIEYIKNNTTPDEREEYYNWGIERIWIE